MARHALRMPRMEALFNTVVPVALVVLSGYLLGRRLEMDLSTLSRLTLYALVPALILDSMYRAEYTLEGVWGLVLGFSLTSALLFALGVYGVLTRRTAILVFLSIELMLNAANLSLVGFARAYGLDGQVAALMVIAVAAAEVAVGLGLIVAIFRHRESTAVDDLSELRG